ncbi:MAG: hypothetical protein HUU57_01400 [Bdellovibrio sp.]|nr:hypothetical protein [Bdellovibrio sp.]
MKFLRLICILCMIFSNAYVHAETALPRNLSKEDRQRALQILGFGSAAKVLDNPYPLGGYTGIELGVASEFIPVEDLASLGSKTTDKGEYNYYTLTFGKGLYYNVDMHAYFTPFGQAEKMQSYGAQIRWGFYELSFFPLSFTAMVYGGGANFANLINITTLGLDILATVAMDNVAVYAGVGQTRAIGKFIGGVDGITDTQETYEEDILEGHSVFGISVDISKVFIALQIDRYKDSVYSGKIGYRF